MKCCHTDWILLTQNLKTMENGKSLDFPNPCDNNGGVAGVSPAEGVADKTGANGG